MSEENKYILHSVIRGLRECLREYLSRALHWFVSLARVVLSITFHLAHTECLPPLTLTTSCSLSDSICRANAHTPLFGQRWSRVRTKQSRIFRPEQPCTYSLAVFSNTHTTHTLMQACALLLTFIYIPPRRLVGGFGLCGIPENLIGALSRKVCV